MSKDDDEKKHEKKNGNGRPNHTGSVAAEDEELSLWLNRLWARNEPPERLEVWQMFGRLKAIRGEMIHHADFRPHEKLDIEQANHLANEIIAAAQNDCDALRREANYQIAITDRNRRSSPLVRRLGPLQPKRAYALTKPGDLEDEDEDGITDPRVLQLKYIQDAQSQARWDKQRYDRVMGEMLMLQASIIQEMRTDRQTLMQQQMLFFEKLQESQDRSLDRELMREREKFKLGLWKEGVRSARNLLPGIFGAAAEANGNGQTNGTNGTNGNGAQGHGGSPERTLVDNFLTDIEEDEKIAVALFGDFQEVDGKMALVTPGIFTVKQYMIMKGVREGKLSADLLDQLVPGWGHENAITQEQVVKAGDAGVTEGMGIALLELLGMRRRKREEKQPEPTK